MKIALLSNQGEIGGGEVMLFAIASALRTLGHAPIIVAPIHHPDVLLRARAEGYDYAGIRSTGRADYLVRLRGWAHRSGADLLWANGMLPATATGGMSRRIVHLHQVPSARLRPLLPWARLGALSVLVPSEWVAERVPGSAPFPNWTTDLVSDSQDTLAPGESGRTRIGFLGRLTFDKGIHTLIESLNVPQLRDRVSLVIGGVTRFGTEDEERRLTALLSSAHFPVTTLGWVRPHDFFSKIDVLAVPSNWGEAFGLVAAEAMSAGIPFVASDDGALPEVAGTGYPFIAERGQAASLAERITELADVGQNRHEREALIVRNRTRWESVFSPSAGTARVAELLTDIEGRS